MSKEPALEIWDFCELLKHVVQVKNKKNGMSQQNLYSPAEFQHQVFSL